jgi:acetylornithine deacetylase/succinyl-diaminopimelate desuccinylase-like protein
VSGAPGRSSGVQTTSRSLLLGVVSLWGLGALFAAGCASPTWGPASVVVTPGPAVDDLVSEVVPLTQALIRARPQNPPGNETAAVSVLAQRLAEEGIAVERASFAEGRENLLATLPGRDRSLPPVVMASHSDVVPADASRWTAPMTPFDAAIVGDTLVGRGAADMLGMVALQTLTLVALKRADEPPLRDVLLVVAGDEEVGSAGIEAAITAWPQLGKAWVALNEGGFIIEDGVAPGRDLIAVSVAEKGVFWFDLVVRGESGHGSVPRAQDAPARLVAATQKVLAMDRPFTLTPPAARMFSAVGAARGGMAGFVMQRPMLVGLIGKGSLEEEDNTRVLVHDTCALTVLNAGYKTNIVPEQARASFDCRLLPGTDPAAFRDRVLLAVDDPRVDVIVHQKSGANGSTVAHPAVDIIRARLEGELKGSATTPLLTRGYTDNRAFRIRGIPAYGLQPVRVNGAELASMHGIDERVRVKELEAGLMRWIDIIGALANTGAAAPQSN